MLYEILIVQVPFYSLLLDADPCVRAAVVILFSQLFGASAGIPAYPAASPPGPMRKSPLSPLQPPQPSMGFKNYNNYLQPPSLQPPTAGSSSNSNNSNNTGSTQGQAQTQGVPEKLSPLMSGTAASGLSPYFANKPVNGQKNMTNPYGNFSLPSSTHMQQQQASQPAPPVVITLDLVIEAEVELGIELLNSCTDGSVMVRRQSVIALYKLVSESFHLECFKRIAKLLKKVVIAQRQKMGQSTNSNGNKSARSKSPTLASNSLNSFASSDVYVYPWNLLPEQVEEITNILREYIETSSDLFLDAISNAAMNSNAYPFSEPLTPTVGMPVSPFSPPNFGPGLATDPAGAMLSNYPFNTTQQAMGLCFGNGLGPPKSGDPSATLFPSSNSYFGNNINSNNMNMNGAAIKYSTPPQFQSSFGNIINNNATANTQASASLSPYLIQQQFQQYTQQLQQQQNKPPQPTNSIDLSTSKLGHRPSSSADQPLPPYLLFGQSIENNINTFAANTTTAKSIHINTNLQTISESNHSRAVQLANNYMRLWLALQEIYCKDPHAAVKAATSALIYKVGIEVEKDELLQIQRQFSSSSILSSVASSQQSGTSDSAGSTNAQSSNANSTSTPERNTATNTLFNATIAANGNNNNNNYIMNKSSSDTMLMSKNGPTTITHANILLQQQLRSSPFTNGPPGTDQQQQQTNTGEANKNLNVHFTNNTTSNTTAGKY